MSSRLQRTRENIAMIRFPLIGPANRVMIRLVVAGMSALAVSACTNGSGGEQSLVDRSALTLQDMMTQNVSQDPKSLLRKAKGVMICPRVFKAGFFVGGEGGSCVLLARSGNGTWSYPTFYDIGSGSFGFQFGIQDSQLLLLIMNERGLNALMDSQVRLGANASVAVATLGVGVQGSTTAAVGADIVAFAAARGLFGGVSLEGGVMSARIDENQSYYGQPLVARQIVLQMQGTNAGADPLREVLTRYGGAEFGPQTPRAGEPPYPGSYSPAPRPFQVPPGYRPASGQSQIPQGYQPQPPQSYQPAQAPSGYQPPPGQYTYPPPPNGGSIQEQNLPPPER
jgi:lipid-binding SYLF domain-containing protein